MAWEIWVSRKVNKAVNRLPGKIVQRLKTLLEEIEKDGPVRGNWPNYSRLSNNRHHCHLKKGRPTYIAVWEEKSGEIQLIEVIYVGTHEKAPY